MNILINSIVEQNELLYMADASKFCTIKFGGKFEYLIVPKSMDAFISYLFALHKHNISFKVLGNFSNIIPCDGIIKGVFITTKFIVSKPKIFGNRIVVDSGANLTALCLFARDNDLSGMEGLFGIPATVGGAIFNNAGAFGQDMSQIVESVLVFNNGKIQNLGKEKLGFDYRCSIFQKSKMIILSATLALTKSNYDYIWQTMQENANKRQTSQPKLPSAGSVFRKYNGVSAGYYIDKAGLKGTKCGDAEISSVHANFIVNHGNATYGDFNFLVDLAQNKVKEKFNILLQKEVEYLGETDDSFSRLSHT